MFSCSQSELGISVASSYADEELSTPLGNPTETQKQKTHSQSRASQHSTAAPSAHYQDAPIDHPQSKQIQPTDHPQITQSAYQLPYSSATNSVNSQSRNIQSGVSHFDHPQTGGQPATVVSYSGTIPSQQQQPEFYMQSQPLMTGPALVQGHPQAQYLPMQQPLYQGQQPQYYQHQNLHGQPPPQVQQHMQYQLMQQPSQVATTYAPVPGYDAPPTQLSQPGQYYQIPLQQPIQQQPIYQPQMQPQHFDPRYAAALQPVTSHPVGMTRGATQMTNSNSQKVSPRSVRQSPRVDSSTSTKTIGMVAPKPNRPNKDFIERNINKARGVNSAKGGYASRMAQSKQQQAEMKNWAPGMVVTRKKAASADNALRAPKPRDDYDVMSAADLQGTLQHQPEMQNVWAQRSSQLAQTKSRPTEKRRGKPISSRRDDQNPTNTGSFTGRESITESRVKFDVNLEPSVSDIHTKVQDTHMKLIGPIPQNHGKNIRQLGQGHIGGDGYSTAAGAIPQHQSPTASSYHHSPRRHSHQSGDSLGYSQNDQFERHSAKQIDVAANQSYSQIYQGSMQDMTGNTESTEGIHTESRWNPRPKVCDLYYVLCTN